MSDLTPFDIEPDIFEEMANLPGNREWMTDGVGDCVIGDSPGSVYIGVVSDDTTAVMAAQPLNDVCAHIHFCMHPKKKARKFTAARALVKGIKRRMPGMTLFCFVPADNRGIQGLIKRIGLVQVGRLAGAHSRNMVRHDMLIYEVR